MSELLLAVKHFLLTSNSNRPGLLDDKTRAIVACSLRLSLTGYFRMVYSEDFEPERSIAPSHVDTTQDSKHRRLGWGLGAALPIPPHASCAVGESRNVVAARNEGSKHGRLANCVLFPMLAGGPLASRPAEASCRRKNFHSCSPGESLATHYWLQQSSKFRRMGDSRSMVRNEPKLACWWLS
jgi:hypothetical protein